STPTAPSELAAPAELSDALSLHDALPIFTAEAQPGPLGGLAHRGVGHVRIDQHPGAQRVGLEHGAGQRLEGPGSGPASGVHPARSEEHTSELQSRESSYAVFCLKKIICPH